MGKRKGHRATTEVVDEAAEFDAAAAGPAPVMVSPGTSTWDEWSVRRTLPDGRVIDSDPMTGVSVGFAITMRAFAYPPGSTVTVRRRQVTAHATEWADADPEDLASVGPLGSHGPFGDAIREMERQALGVVVDESPMAPVAPGMFIVDGYAMVQVAGWAADLMRTGAFERDGERRWETPSDAARLRHERWVQAGYRADGRALMWRPVPAVPAGEQPTEDLTVKAAEVADRYNAEQRAAEQRADTDTDTDWRRTSHNHSEHERGQYVDTCHLCVAEAAADANTKAEQP